MIVDEVGRMYVNVGWICIKGWHEKFQIGTSYAKKIIQLLHSASKSSQDTMQHQEKYTLQWNSYSDHLRKVLREMMTSSEFAM